MTDDWLQWIMIVALCFYAWCTNRVLRILRDRHITELHNRLVGLERKHGDFSWWKDGEIGDQELDFHRSLMDDEESRDD